MQTLFPALRKLPWCGSREWKFSEGLNHRNGNTRQTGDNGFSKKVLSINCGKWNNLCPCVDTDFYLCLCHYGFPQRSLVITGPLSARRSTVLVTNAVIDMCARKRRSARGDCGGLSLLKPYCCTFYSRNTIKYSQILNVSSCMKMFSLYFSEILI